MIIKEKLNTATVGIKDLLTKAESIKAKSDDYILRKPKIRENIWFENDGKIYFTSDEGCKISASLSEHAIEQLGAKIGVPGQYILSCIENGFCKLAQDNINSWIPNYKGGFMFRKTDDHLRAVLSPRYTTYDSEQILDIVQRNVDLSDYSIRGSYISEERLHIRLIGNERMHIDGEDLFPALFLDSSDVGRNILIIRFGIYKLVCTNGLVIGRADGILYRQKHIGVKADEFEVGLVSGLKKVPVLTMNAEGWVHKVQKEAMDIDAAYSYLKSMKLNADGQDKVIKLMNNRYGMTKWGLINGITEVAQDYTLDRREELEAAAGNILAKT